MRKIIVLWMVLMIVSLRAFADSKVSFTASAPDVVAVGDQFRLSYTVTTQKVRDFRAPSIKGFDVLMGPSRSQQKSVQVINGQTTSTSSITFTYILMATAEGSFTIPGATITAEGNQMVSNSVHVKVLTADTICLQSPSGVCTACRPVIGALSGISGCNHSLQCGSFEFPCAE